MSNGLNANMAVQQFFCLDRFSRKEKQLNNDKEQVKISHYVEKHESEASQDRMSCLFPYKMLTISVIHNFATVEPKTLKLCKMIHLAALVYVISLISLKTWPNKKLPNGYICIRCIQICFFMFLKTKREKFENFA